MIEELEGSEAEVEVKPDEAKPGTSAGEPQHEEEEEEARDDIKLLQQV